MLTAKPSPPSPEGDLLIPSLAALVVRLAQMSLVEERMISGTSWAYGSPVGLRPEDRRAMSAVSRACLVSGLPDHGAEIHQLLALCSRPLHEWLSVPEVTQGGLKYTRLIDAEEGIPTAEAEELAAAFPGMTAGIEELLFAKLMEMLNRHPADEANAYYTKIREFVVRHPVCDVDELKAALAREIPTRVWIMIQNEFYEAVPSGWSIDGMVHLCGHCGNAMKFGKAALVCRTSACSTSTPSSSPRSVKADTLMRVSRGIRQYWVEPGIDELRLYDALVERGVPAELYPFRDRVDIAVGDVGIDLKCYVSPETLGLKFKRSIGGLAYYLRRWLVIPDWQITFEPSYVDRLVTTMDRQDVKCLTVSEAILELTAPGTTHA
jgi:hypothetical protein